MGTQVWTTFTIGGKIDANKVDELQDLMLENGILTAREAIEQGVNLSTEGECSYGNFEELEGFCTENGLTYIKSWGASPGEFHSGVERYDGETGESTDIGADDDGRAVMTAKEIREALADGRTIEGILAYLDSFDPSSVPPLKVDDLVARAGGSL